ncbi:MAG TPA: oligopeptide transporter, OPT family [Sphingomonas sp.]
MEQAQRELTLRGLLLGAALTLVFTAANVFLGLRVGLTFSTSIPAAVISMAALKAFKSAGILENNIVQTVASAAGTLSSVIFVLPGLIMIGWWVHFPFWQSALICASGGMIGVMFSIPLRRALVTGSDLPFPEGCAAAEVLRIGAGDVSEQGGPEEAKAGFAILLLGAIVSGLFALLTAMKLTADEASVWFRVQGTNAASGLGFGLSFALAGVGHLVGISVGLAMLLGMVIAFGIATPLLTAMQATPGAAIDAASDVWGHQVRFIGAGVIGVAAIWTLGGLIMPILRGLAESAASSKARKTGGGLSLPVEERDMPIAIVGMITAALVIPVAGLLWYFAGTGPLAPFALRLTVIGTLYIFVGGLLVASVCGYMAGLIGASNSPVSGLAILAVLGAALLLVAGVAPLVGADAVPQMIAFALFVTAILLCAATIANDNLQDLKTGQLVGATPWKQQAALMLGVVGGALTIPPVLDLLNSAYGFGAASAAHASPLPAPQAVLITALAKGVLGHDLDWTMVGIGAALGVALIVLDGALGRAGKLRISPLAVGLGIYLPMTATLPTVIGSIIGHRWEARNPAPAARRMGVLMASGLIVGESLFGVVVAALIVITGSPTPLAVAGDGFHDVATWGGALLFAVLLAFCYRRTTQVARMGG